MNVLITGATAGIGLEFARIFASNGYNLALVARNQARLSEIAESLKTRHRVEVRTIAADLAQPASPRRIFDELQRSGFNVSVLVNNAGFGVHGNFIDTDLASEMDMLQVNMGSLAQLTKLFMKPMVAAGQGRILNVASLASFAPGPYMAIYAATKVFILSFSCALSVELEGTGVTATALCPGGTNTEFQQRAGMKSGPSPISARQVAEIGYKAMLQGRPLIVAGRMNNLIALMFKTGPAMLAARVAGRFNKHQR